jgi:hypothetical protein
MLDPDQYRETPGMLLNSPALVCFSLHISLQGLQTLASSPFAQEKIFAPHCPFSPVIPHS